MIGPINIKAPTTHDRGGQGIHFKSDLLPPCIKQIKSDDAKQCILVIIGVTSSGNKGFLAIEDGYREIDERQRNSAYSYSHKPYFTIMPRKKV
jgi:hypothetical protein